MGSKQTLKSKAAPKQAKAKLKTSTQVQAEAVAAKSERLTPRAYAVHRGVHNSDVRKALASGKIKLGDDGLVEVATADAAWDSGTTPNVHDSPSTVKDKDGKKVSFAEARTTAELLKQEALELKLDEKRGNLIDKSAANNAAFTFARRLRDAWVGWPARVAALLAAKFDADPHAMEVELDRLVEENLEAIGNHPIDLR